MNSRCFVLRELGVTDISNILNVSRQFVHKALQTIEIKNYRALIGVTKANRIELISIDPKRGHLRRYGIIPD